MKIGILTFHCAINYGAVLQAYGLQEVLKSMGHNVYIIDYRPEYLKSPYRLFFPEAVKGRGIIGNIRSFIRELLAFPIRYKRRCAFNQFIEKHLRLSSLDFYNENNDFDCFVFGSDQIWNLKITQGDSVFFGDAPCFKGKRLLTYAASAGNASSLKDVDNKCLKRWLSNFSSLSVREKSLSDFLLEELKLESQLVLDPVLCAGKDVFHKIATPKLHNKPYLLFFSLFRDDEVLNMAKRYAELHHLDVIEMYSMTEIIKNKRVLQFLLPEDFVNYFINANYIVTTSYHGTIFSILFHKPFVCVGKFAISRFYSLLRKFGLEDRIMNISCTKDLFFTDVDWTVVDDILSHEQNEAKLFLAKSLILNKYA